MNVERNGEADVGRTPGWAERWLSPERLAPYLSACGGDADRALALYEWNAGLGHVLAHDIAHLEIALRNAYDVAMRAAWGDGWLVDDGSPARRPVMRRSAGGELDANRINRRTIDSAARRLPRGYSHGDLVAALTFGFWVHLADRSREAVIWRTGLYRAWPRGKERAPLQSSLLGILRLRNRIAHNERLFGPSGPALSPLLVDSDALRLFGELCPEAAGRFRGAGPGTPAEAYVSAFPPPADVAL